jgi:tetratricopeptide (TPR) repeat protein
MVVALLMGCAAMGVPARSDPREKMGWALNLYEKQDRPLPAERLIMEAREIFQERNDELGLAESYRQYAFFLESEAVGHWEFQYRKTGFLDKSISYDARYEKAIEYFQKARDIYVKEAKHDALTNIDLVMGNTFLKYIGDQSKACQCYDQSLADYQEFTKVDPTAKIVLPAEFKSYADYIAAVKKRAKCI